jgi:hypothetical protein
MSIRRPHLWSFGAVAAVALACSATSLAQGGKIVPVVCVAATPAAQGYMCAPNYRCEGQGSSWSCVNKDGNRLSAARFSLCATSRDCDDGLFCNGAEVCMPGAPGSDYRGCVLAPRGPCPANQACNEALDQCVSTCADADRDGHFDVRCGGDDCDDADPDRYPGHVEVCDAAGHDEDCNPCTVSGESQRDGDKDADGYVDVRCSNPFVYGTPTAGMCGPSLFVDLVAKRVTGRDCDDANEVIRPGVMICAGAGVSICPANGPLASGTTPGRYVERACPAGTRCQPQPNGTGVCR